MTVGWIDLEGAYNVRDLGGLAVAGGGRTRHDVLLRSDALDQLSAADVERLVDGVGLAHVVDLRSAGERHERGRGRLGATGVRYTEVEVIGPDDLARRAEARAAAFARAEPAARIIADGYVELLDIGAPAFGAAFAAIAAPGGTPALVHCAIGKDRTGVLTAVLLDAAGVERDEIVADYALTGGRMAPIIERWMVERTSAGMTEQLAAFTASAAPETMEQLLDALHERWGGGAAYLEAAGQPAGLVASWREQLAG